MIKKNLILIFLFSILITSTAFKQSASTHLGEWKLEKNDNGVKIYTRQSEGSKIKEFKAITTVSAKMEALESLIENVMEYPNWQANLETAKILKVPTATSKYIYYTSDIPWPIADRDIVVYSEKIVSTDNVVVYNLISKPDYLGEKEGYVRIRVARGMWRLAPQADNKIEVTYQFYGDPAGSLPGWVINMFIVEGPFTTMSNLKKKVEK